MYRQHLFQLFERHKAALIYSVSLAIVLMVFSYNRDAMLKTSVFMVTVLLCFLISEFIYYSGKLKFPPWQIKAPGQEFKVALLCEAMGVLVLVTAFILVDPSTLPRVAFIFLMAMRVLFIFPIAVLCYLLAIKRYSLKAIGFQFQHWFVALPIIVLIGGVSYFIFPEGVQWGSIIEQNGYLSIVMLGFLTAAFPEEILRTFFQTRLSKVRNSKAFGWFMASFIWAISHVPFFGNQSGDYGHATVAAIGIMPLGLLWGYLNERYRSIIPSVLIHGTNLWGLHNIY